MADATADFFNALAERGHEPLLESATGTVGFELADGKKTERWLVSIDKGDLTVSHRNLGADCTLRAKKSLFEKMAGGTVNATAAVLRGEVMLEGDWELMVLFQRLFPGPPGSRRPTTDGNGR